MAKVVYVSKFPERGIFWSRETGAFDLRNSQYFLPAGNPKLTRLLKPFALFEVWDSNGYGLVRAGLIVPKDKYEEIVANLNKKQQNEEKEAKKLAEDPKMLALALYSVNKAAKRQRDAANNSYSGGAKYLAFYFSQKKEKYYQLKNEVIKKLEKEGKAKLVAFHQQTVPKVVAHFVCEDCGEEVEDFREHREWCGGEVSKEFETIEVKQWLALYEFEGFYYHLPISQPSPEEMKKVSKVKDLGLWMSSRETKIKTLKLEQAQKILEAYLKTSS